MKTYEVVFKKSDGTYIDVVISLKEEAVYTVEDGFDEGDDYFEVIHEPKFHFNPEGVLFRDMKSSDRIELLLLAENNYWDYVEDYEI